MLIVRVSSNLSELLGGASFNKNRNLGTSQRSRRLSVEENVTVSAEHGDAEVAETQRLHEENLNSLARGSS